MKKLLNVKFLSIIAIIFLVIYILSCLILSMLVSKTVKSVYASECYENLNAPLDITENGYERLDFKKHYFYENKGTTTKFSSTFPISFIGITKCKVFLKYKYELCDNNGEVIAGGSDVWVEVKLKLCDGKLKVVEAIEKFR